jgi:flagellar hook assembly protein FlgD
VIYNVLGQRIRTLVASPVKAGYHRVVWDGRDEHGNNVPSGVYFYSFRAGEYSANKKMVLLR